MLSNGPGRPPKPAAEKRRQLHISLYAEDIDRLEELTDNRSEFVRQTIAKAWSERVDGDVTFSLTVPKCLVKELLQTVEPQLSPKYAAIVHMLMKEVLSDG
jgi:hypothetical protein